MQRVNVALSTKWQGSQHGSQQADGTQSVASNFFRKESDLMDALPDGKSRVDQESLGVAPGIWSQLGQRTVRNRRINSKSKFSRPLIETTHNPPET